MTFICYVVGGFESVWEMEQMISEILSSSSLLRFDDSKNGSLPSCLSHLSQRQKPGRGPAGSDTDADQDSPILQVLLFMEFNLVMHCTRDLYINQPFHHFNGVAFPVHFFPFPDPCFYLTPVSLCLKDFLKLFL